MFVNERCNVRQKTIVRTMFRLFGHYVSAPIALLIVLDALVFLSSAYAGVSFVHVSAVTAMEGSTSTTVASYATVVAIGMLAFMNIMGLYRQDVLKELRAVPMRMMTAVAVGLGAVIVTAHLVASASLGWTGVAMMALVALAGSALVRFVLRRLNRLSAFKSRVLVLGTGSRATRLAEFARHNHSCVVVGFLALQSSTHHVPLRNILPIAPGESLLAIVKKYRIDQIVIAVRDRRAGGLPVQELMECRLKGIKVTELPAFFEREYRQVLLESLNPSWFVLGEGFRQAWFTAAVKRIFDLTASIALLLLTLPLQLVAAVCIYLTDGGPMHYRQVRVGQGGRPFTIYKLRSMRNDAEADGTPRWAATDDERTTRVGRIIRKLRIDELPQIINVLKGDMSFVGPRPERPFFVDQLKQQIPYYALGHSIKPGITGWAQVRYPYGASLDDVIEKLQYDLYYVKNHTLFLDLMILVATVEVVLWGKGAR